MELLKQEALKGKIIIPNGYERCQLSRLSNRRIEQEYRNLFKLRFGFNPVGFWKEALLQEIENIYLTPTFIQKGARVTIDPGTSLTPTITGVTAGNFVASLISAARFSTTPAAVGTPSLFSVAESNGGTGNQNGYSTAAGIFYKANVASGSHPAAYTGLPAGGTAADGMNLEFSGIATSLPLDTAHNHNSGSGATSGNTGASGTSTSTTPLWLAINMAENGVNTASFTSSVASYTTIYNSVNDSASTAFWAGYQVAVANTTQTVAATWSPASLWIGCIAGFLPAGGAIVVINDANFRRLSRGLGFGLVRGGH